MTRRDVLRLGAVGTGIFATGGLTRVAARATAQSRAVPTVDRLVMTNVVDNIYDVFAKGGTLDSITIERPGLRFGADGMLAEHGLAYPLESVRGWERRQIRLDFSLTERNLFNNYKVLKVDPAAADGLIISHGHADHYGALADYARFVQGRTKPGLTLYAGGEDTFCHRVVATPSGSIDQGQLDRAGLEARGLAVMLAKQPTVVAGHAITSGQIPRLTDFEKPPAAARLVAGAEGPAGSGAPLRATKVEGQTGGPGGGSLPRRHRPPPP